MNIKVGGETSECEKRQSDILPIFSSLVILFELMNFNFCWNEEEFFTRKERKKKEERGYGQC